MSECYQGLPVLEESTMISYLAKAVKAYFQDEQHRRDFEKWHKETYGTDYIWKDGKTT